MPSFRTQPIFQFADLRSVGINDEMISACIRHPANLSCSVLFGGGSVRCQRELHASKLVLVFNVCCFFSNPSPRHKPFVRICAPCRMTLTLPSAQDQGDEAVPRNQLLSVLDKSLRRSNVYARKIISDRIFSSVCGIYYYGSLRILDHDTLVVTEAPTISPLSWVEFLSFGGNWDDATEASGNEFSMSTKVF